MQRVRVLVANRPRLMRELVLATITDQADIEVVGVVEDPTALVETVAQSRPDFLIISLDGSEDRPHVCDLLLDRFPQLKILALAAESNSSIFYWASLDIRSNRIETSEEGILNTIRGRVFMIQPPVAAARQKAN